MKLMKKISCRLVTDNEASFKAPGHLLMEKREHLFWSPCVAHCIDLMLEDIDFVKSIKETLDDAKLITSFIYNSLKVVNLMNLFIRERFVETKYNTVCHRVYFY